MAHIGAGTVAKAGLPCQTELPRAGPILRRRPPRHPVTDHAESDAAAPPLHAVIAATEPAGRKGEPSVASSDHNPLTVGTRTRSGRRPSHGDPREAPATNSPGGTERSHRGLVQRFAKPPSGVTCSEGSNPSLSATHRAPVAQWIEHQLAELGVVGSNPAGRATRPCTTRTPRHATGLLHVRSIEWGLRRRRIVTPLGPARPRPRSRRLPLAHRGPEQMAVTQQRPRVTGAARRLATLLALVALVGSWTGTAGAPAAAALVPSPTLSAIDGGRASTCALVTDGTIRCWGANNGALGNGSARTSIVPVTVTGIATATGIAVGAGQACAVLADGTVRCWGDNEVGPAGERHRGGLARPGEGARHRVRGRGRGRWQPHLRAAGRRSGRVLGLQRQDRRRVVVVAAGAGAGRRDRRRRRARRRLVAHLRPARRWRDRLLGPQRGGPAGRRHVPACPDPDRGGRDHRCHVDRCRGRPHVRRRDPTARSRAGDPRAS